MRHRVTLVIQAEELWHSGRWPESAGFFRPVCDETFVGFRCGMSQGRANLTHFAGDLQRVFRDPNGFFRSGRFKSQIGANNFRPIVARDFVATKAPIGLH